MIEVRPSARFVGGLRVGLVIAAVGLAVRRALADHAVTLDAVLPAIALLALGLFGIALFRRNRLVSKTADRLTVRSMLRLEHHVAISAIHTAYFVPNYFQSKEVEALRLVLRDHDDRVLLRLDSAQWEREEIAALAEDLDGVVVLPADLGRKQLIKQYPQVASYPERRPWHFGAIVVGALVAFIIALTWVLSTLGI